MPQIWQQIYDPFNNMIVSTLFAAIPVVVMLVGLGFLHMKAHLAAGAGLIAALAIAIFAYGMPAAMAGNAALFGGLTGLLPIGWTRWTRWGRVLQSHTNPGKKMLVGTQTSRGQGWRERPILMADKLRAVSPFGAIHVKPSVP